jgi:hypothetical protein
MSAAMIIGLLIQIISGAIGGNIFAKVTQFTLGPVYNSVMGAIGGAIGGIIFQGLGPGLTSGDSLGVGFLLLQAAIGAVSGAILTVFASLFWNPIDY